MNSSKKYTNELRKQFGYFATWLPGTPLKLGDVGVLRNNIFTKLTNLSELGVEFEIFEDKTPSDLEHTTKGAVSMSVKSAGAASLPGSSLQVMDAGLTLEFSKENAIYFLAKGTTSPSIKDQIKLGQKIVKFFEDGKWDKDWAVITEVVNSKSATIIISSSSEGKIELKVNGDVEIGSIDLADSSIGFELVTSKSLSTKILAESKLTPLFKASQVKTSWFIPPVFRTHNVKSMDLMTPEKAKANRGNIFFGEADFELDSE